MSQSSPRMPRHRNPRTARIAISVTPTVKAELEMEAFEEQRSLSDYIAGLLERRGKWARTVSSGGPNNYDIAMPAKEKP